MSGVPELVKLFDCMRLMFPVDDSPQAAGNAGHPLTTDPRSPNNNKSATRQNDALRFLPCGKVSSLGSA